MKNTLIIASLAMLGAAIFTTGCKKTASQQFLTQYYQVNYNESGGASAMAAFHTLGRNQNVILDRADRIKANGMTSYGAPGNYSWNIDNTQQDITFTLELRDKTLTNTLTRDMVGNIDFSIDSVFAVGDTIRIRWIGQRLPSDELNFSIGSMQDSMGIYKGTVVGTFDADNESFYFDPEQTKNFPAGNYYVTMNKVRSFPLQQSDNNASGQILARVMAQKNIVIR